MSPPAPSITSSKPSARHRDIQERRLPDLRGPGRTARRLPDPHAGPHPLPLPLRRRHLRPPTEGGREVGGVISGASETEAFWAQVLRSLRERGLIGVRPVISDSHRGRVKAIRKVMLGAVGQRC
ncbi:hypothetical protein STRTUCAR8_10114 [Streptomyces turgidiscabies Car8]|uniref:Mutator family transposase n=1 Tax=Streptomyces turgidiscabies (strain Car8) TaxID=698760 RepID=L7FHN1_STRT8|nr:hypothetical protein STRTUCAR8_10114 [Streptomyces turgidiscabies Car8]